VTPLPTPVLAFYGDDFTGSGAVMEVLSFAGLPTVLFLAPPTPADLARFPGARAIGLAGDARTWSPERMRTELPAICASLRALGAPILHYKLCSTLDSAPGIGSIGTAAEVALAPGALAPLVVAAPEIGRWQAFGTLFARAGDGRIHRLDRHPTMSVHPVTPMDEADVLRHLARQTSLPLALADLNDLKSGRGPDCLAEAQETGGILAIDVVDTETLAAAWRRAGLLPPAPTLEPLAPTGRIAVVSGSCSPTTAAQIDAAEAAGFAVIDLCPGEPDWDAATRAALTVLADGRSPLVATSRGQNDTGADPSLGAGLGRLLDRLIRETGITRSVIAGGDTSSAAARALGLTALTAETPIAPGAPLLRGHRAEGPSIELVMKGGQMGPTDFFVHVRDGLPPTAGAAGRMRRNA
jgi:uncharacterized protein YgbK (DUF1537 family)